MHADRPSITAAVVAAIRALYTALPEPYRAFEDPYAARLIPAALALPSRAAARFPWAAPLLHRGLGAASLGITYHAALRTRAIDDAARAAISKGAEQVVVLGAGLDSRALRMPELRGAVVFEIDHPSTQRYKIARLAGALGDPFEQGAHQTVRRVPVNFETERLTDVLPASGLQASVRSFWIWEGVTVYLTKDALTATLRAIAELSPSGSSLAVSYTPPLAGALAALDPLVRAGFFGIGEPVRTMLTQREMAALLDDAGFSIESDTSTADWAELYWPFELPGAVRVIERLAIGVRR